MKIFYLIISLLFSISTFSQSASIYGKITDKESGEELIYANIVLFQNGVFAIGGSTDFEGNYSLPVDPGIYEMRISYTGYVDKKITDILVGTAQKVKLDVIMENPLNLEHAYTPCCCIPLIDQNAAGNLQEINSEDIRNRADKEIKQIISNMAGVSINNF